MTVIYIDSVFLLNGLMDYLLLLCAARLAGVHVRRFGGRFPYNLPISAYGDARTSRGKQRAPAAGCASI